MDISSTQKEMREIARNLDLKSEDLMLAFYIGLKKLRNTEAIDLLKKGKELY